MKFPFIIYADMDSLLDKCHNNPGRSLTTKHIHIYSYSLFMHCSFDTRKNKHSYYRGNDCMKNFLKNLKNQASKIINSEKKIIPLTNEENQLYHNQHIC